MRLAILSMVVAIPLGWLFAPRALVPGTKGAVIAAAGITLVAVRIGAVVIGRGMVAGRSELTLGETLGGLLFAVVAGLVLFGLLLGCLTFVNGPDRAVELNHRLSAPAQDRLDHGRGHPGLSIPSAGSAYRSREPRRT